MEGINIRYELDFDFTENEHKQLTEIVEAMMDERPDLSAQDVFEDALDELMLRYDISEREKEEVRAQSGKIYQWWAENAYIMVDAIDALIRAKDELLSISNDIAKTNNEYYKTCLQEAINAITDILNDAGTD